MRRIKRVLASIAMLIMTVNANAWPWLSPYAYCMGNPVKFMDLDGRKIVLAENSSEDFIKQFNNAFNYLQSHNAARVWMQLDDK